MRHCALACVAEIGERSWAIQELIVRRSYESERPCGSTLVTASPVTGVAGRLSIRSVRTLATLVKTVPGPPR